MILWPLHVPVHDSFVLAFFEAWLIDRCQNLSPSPIADLIRPNLTSVDDQNDQNDSKMVDDPEYVKVTQVSWPKLFKN